MRFYHFNSIYFHYMYREINGEGDGLSKACLQLENGMWHIPDLKDSQHSEYFHPTFFEFILDGGVYSDVEASEI